MTPQFCDISQFQPASIDWQAYKAWSAQGDGISRVAMRSSYGVGYKDAHFEAYRTGAINAGIDQIIFYHYAYPQFNLPQDEANWQMQVVASIRPQDILVLDFEESVAQANAAWAYAWLAQQEHNYLGKPPGLYASSAYIAERLQGEPRLGLFPLWLANWQYTPDERPPCPPPWASYQAVQYTDKATNIPGIASTVDVNIFLGVEIPQEVPTMIDLTNGTVASHFEGGPDIWKCKDNGFFVGYGILGFYQRFGGDALCGLTYLGLPAGDEQAVLGHPGVVMQKFERACVAYDPQHVLDNPPGSGDCYLVHTSRDPRNAALQAEVVTLQNQLDANVQAQEIAALQAKIAAAQKDLA